MARLRCIVHERPQPRPDICAPFAELATSLISDSMERTGGVVGVHPVSRTPLASRSMVGPALTVETAAGDNLVIHQALELIEPGDVLVVDGRGYADRALMGEIMCTYAAAQGAAGIVIDGAVRDLRGLRSLDLPVYARAISHLGPYKNGPGRINGVVSVGGVPVRGGDMVVGDFDGVVVVPLAAVDEVIDAAQAQAKIEASILEAIRAGSYTNSWLADAVEVAPSPPA